MTRSTQTRSKAKRCTEPMGSATFTTPSAATRGSAPYVVAGCAEHGFRWIAHVSECFFKRSSTNLPQSTGSPPHTSDAIGLTGSCTSWACGTEKHNLPKCVIPLDVLDRDERALLRKMVWLECKHECRQNAFSIWTRTALIVLMLSQSGWAKITDAKDKISFLGSDQKRVITLTLVVSKTGDVSAQLIFGGKTSRVHPDAPPPDWCLHFHSESLWMSVTTLQEICYFMSDKVHGKKFIMLMDLCPVHCCRHFLDWSHEALPNMLLAFVPPGMTAQLQPLDRAYVRTVKSEIRQAAARSLAHDVIAAHRIGAMIQLDMRLPSLKPRLVQRVTTARDATVVRPEICELAGARSLRNTMRGRGGRIFLENPVQLSKSANLEWSRQSPCRTQLPLSWRPSNSHTRCPERQGR